MTSIVLLISNLHIQVFLYTLLILYNTQHNLLCFEWLLIYYISQHLSSGIFTVTIHLYHCCHMEIISLPIHCHFFTWCHPDITCCLSSRYGVCCPRPTPCHLPRATLSVRVGKCLSGQNLSSIFCFIPLYTDWGWLFVYILQDYYASAPDEWTNTIHETRRAMIDARILSIVTLMLPIHQYHDYIILPCNFIISSLDMPSRAPIGYMLFYINITLTLTYPI